MSHRKLAFLLAVIMVTPFVSGQTELKGKNYTPKSVNNKYRVWGGKINEPRAKRADVKDVWYSNYTVPASGYIILKSGVRLDGQIVVRYRFNEASTLKVRKETRNGVEKVPHPDGVSGIEEVTISNGQGTQTYSVFDLKLYGLNFKMRDWARSKSKDPALAFHPGELTLKGGDEKQGFLRMTSFKSRFKNVNYYGLVYFAKDENLNVEIYRAGEVQNAVILVNEKDVYLDDFNGQLVKSALLIQKLESKPKKIGFDELEQAEVVLGNGSKLRGKIAFSRKKKKSAIFIDQNGREVNYYYAAKKNDIRSITLTPPGNAMENIVAYEGVYLPIKQLLAQLQKKKLLQDATIVQADGQHRQGRLVKRKRGKTIRGFYFFPNGENSFLENYGASDGITQFKTSEDGQSISYVALNGRFVGQDRYISDLESRRSKNKIKELQNGWIVLKDGERKDGRIIQYEGSITLVDENRDISSFAFSSQQIDYFVQSIGGVDRKFMGMQHGIRAFSGPGWESIEVMYPFSRYSYYTNPNPTHIKKALTAIAKTGIRTAVEVGQLAAANLAAQATVRSELENVENSSTAGLDMLSATVQGVEAQAATMELTQGLVRVTNEGGIYYDEWIIVDNESGSRAVIYKGNEQVELTKLLSQCGNFEALSSTRKQKITTTKGIDGAVQFLNGCSG